VVCQNQIYAKKGVNESVISHPWWRIKISYL